MRNAKLESIARKYYDASLPYHNFNHVLKAVEAGMHVVERCRSKGVPLDEVIVYCAILFHDAGFREDPSRHGFASKEEYAARIAADELVRLGYTPDLVLRVQEAIVGTQRDAKVGTGTNELKAVRAADLAQLAETYPVFRANAIALLREEELLGGTRIPWEDWKKRILPTLEYYLSQNLYLTTDPGADPEAQDFHVRARRNIKMLRDDPGP